MLKKIVLKNFMCHNFLELNLNPRVNFITGKNGSGKSAIVVGLMVGLGQRAFSTNRAQSLKSLIKKGKHTASIEITINNSHNNFKPKVFGNELTVVRLITSSNSCSYFLKDSQGTKHPCNLKTLHKLLLHFNIQPNNPLCILNQDVSRVFFAKHNPRSLYKIFVNATLLKPTTKALEEGDKMLKKNGKVIAKREEELKKLCGEIDLLRKLQCYNIKLKKMRKISSRLKTEKTCAKVLQVDKKIDILDGKYLKLKGEKRKVEQEMAALKNSDLESRIKNLEEKYELSEKKMSNLEIERRKIEKKINIINEECNELKNIQLEHKYSIKMKENDINYYQEVIDNHSKNVEEYERKKDELRCLQIRETEIAEAIDSAQTHVIDSKKILVEAEMKSNSIDNQIKKVKNELSEYKNKIKEVDENRKLGAYGKWIPRIVQEIERNQKLFTKKPKGPLGIYITIRDGVWAPVAEYHMKSHLTSFLFNSSKDLKVFNEIIGNIVPQTCIPDAIICEFVQNVHNYTQSEVMHHKYSSMIKQLDVSDPDVLNYLIDELWIEQILLVPNEIESCLLCEKPQNVPKNLKMCLTANGDTIYPSPGYKFFAGRMKSNRNFYLKVASNSVELPFPQKYHNMLPELIAEKEEMKNRIEAMIENINKTYKSIEELKSQMRTMKSKQFHLKNVLDNENPLSVESSTNEILLSVTAKEELLRKNEQNILALARKEAELNIERDKLKLLCDCGGFEESRLIQEALNSTRENMRMQQKHLKSLDEELISISKKTKDIEKQRNILQKKVDVLKDCTHMKRISGKEIQWRYIRSLPIVAMHEKSILEESIKLKGIISELSSGLSGTSEITRELKKKKRFFAQLQKQYEKLREDNESQIKGIKEEERVNFRIVKDKFNKILRKVNLQGTIHVNYANETIEFKISKRESKKHETSVVSSLSGGERSFATVAFIMSVWHCMTVPFYVMDEFDVFMDVVSRDLILDVLLDYAAECSDQFLFFTPHDLRRIDTRKKYVSVHSVRHSRLR